MSEKILATIIADSAAKFINDNKLSQGFFTWQDSASALSVSKGIRCVFKALPEDFEVGRIKE